MRISVALVSLTVCLAASSAQVKPNARKSGSAPPSEKSSKTTAVQALKCADMPGATACKSFKELFAAKDEDLVESVLGFDDPDFRRRNVSYVCFQPDRDSFMVISYLRPDHFHRSALDISPLAMTEMDEPKLKFSLRTEDLWLKSHDQYHVYSQGSVEFTLYQDGIETDSRLEMGEWSAYGTASSQPISSEEASFESVTYWMEAYNSKDSNQDKVEDNPKRAHIGIDGSSIYVHYSYENKNNSLTDYTLTIQPNTGRFTERFDSAGMNPMEDSGKCAIFR
jgi:hypothetical protein